MKKSLFIASLVLLSAWIAGAFIFKAPVQIHSLLVLSGVAWLRSLMLPGAA